MVEAWNRYTCVRLAYDRSIALELVKCQTITVMLFANHSPLHCLDYNSLFRQAAACDPSLCWDTIKEACMSGPSHNATTLVHPNFSRAPKLFMTDSQSQLVLGPFQLSKAKPLHRMPHTLQKASGTMWDTAQGGKNASSHMSAGTQAARVSTLAKSAPNVPELQRALTPLTTLPI